MTEVPEHLLKRAAEARSRLSGEPAPDTGDTAAPATGESTTPVPAAAATPATPAEPTPEPVVPDAPYVAAAKARKTIPFWVMPVLLFLPIWAIFYVGTLENPPITTGLAIEGAEVYASCSGCHGGGGGGGSGRQLNGGEVTLTFPDPATSPSGYDGLAGQIAWVANGTAATQELEGGAGYGDPDRPGGQHEYGGTGANMGGFGNVLSLEELVAVVYHERAAFGALPSEVLAEELEVLEEFIVLREEAGDTEIEGETVAEIHEQLEEVRTELGVGGEMAAAG